MHELGIVFNIAKTVEEFAKENNLKHIDTIVLEVGAIASVIPKYLSDCYPAAVDASDLLRETKLKIEVSPAYVRCNNCEEVYNVVEHNRICPKCGKVSYEILSGTEFFIKEIIVPDEECPPDNRAAEMSEYSEEPEYKHCSEYFGDDSFMNYENGAESCCGTVVEKS